MAQEQIADAKLAQDVDEIVDRIYAVYPKLLRIKNASQASDLPPDLQVSFNSIPQLLQMLSSLVLNGDPQTVANSPTIAQPEPTKSSGQRPVKPPRRPRSPAFDFLLLEALDQRAAFGFPISQEDLFNLARSFEAQTKKPSLVAKLNRWKNTEPDGLVRWQVAEDLSLTKVGRAERDRLYPYVMRDGHEEGLKQAFRNAWKIDVSFRRP